ncbi:MAG: sigma-70 family RNA polymerase sigma factor [Coriobacteriia bacterium]|nr:sigma-70 family RNA polymerase sigma factor [Coriobacteriia bacterium]
MKTISKQNEIRLFKEIESNSRHSEIARNKIIYAYKYLVKSIANKFYASTLDDDDLMQAGMIAMDEAISRYDFRRGVKFSTFAYPFVHAAIKREIQNNDRCIKIPVHKQEHISIIERAKQEFGGHITNEQIAKGWGIDLEEIKLLEYINKPISSINNKIYDKEYAEFFKDKNIEDNDDKLYRKELWKFSENFSEDEKQVLKLRYTEELSYADIGKKLECSREKVRQIDNKILNKYRDMIVG